MAGKEDFIKVLHDGAGLTLRDAAECIDIMTEWIVETLSSGEKIELRGLGTFSVSKVAETKMACTDKVIPAHGRVIFKPALRLKKMVRETLYLQSIPGMVDSIKKAASESLEDGIAAEAIDWNAP